MSDQPKRPVETPREWLRYSDDDMTVAEREMQAKMPVYHVICFLSENCRGAICITAPSDAPAGR